MQTIIQWAHVEPETMSALDLREAAAAAKAGGHYVIAGLAILEGQEQPVEWILIHARNGARGYEDASIGVAWGGNASWATSLLPGEQARNLVNEYLNEPDTFARRA